MAGKKQNMAPMMKNLMKNVDLDEPTSFLDHVYLGCTQRECKPKEIIIDEYRKMFESRVSAGETEKLPGLANPYAQTVAWSYDMEGHAQKCVERYCEQVNKKTEHLCKVSSPCLDDDHCKKEELESVGELSKVWSQIVLKCSYPARIGRPDILWPVNKFARSVTKWTGACDRILARLMSYIHHTSGYRQYCHVGNTAQHCRLGLFEDSHLAGDLWGLKINLGWNLMYFRKSNTCFQKLDVQETNVSIHSSTESEMISFDAGLRMGGFPAYDLMGCGDRSVTFIEPHQNTNPPRNRKLLAKSQIQTRTKGKPRCWSIVACGLRWPQTQILLKASLSCTSLKITKQWSKWSSKAEVQRWDTYQEPTELRLICYLTESIWTPRSKSNMLTPKTNSRTCWPKVVLHVMNGTIFFDCWTSWISRCFPAAIFFQTESRVSCSRELRKARLKKVRQWRNRDRWIWCQGTSWAQRKPLRKFECFE